MFGSSLLCQSRHRLAVGGAAVAASLIAVVTFGSGALAQQAPPTSLEAAQREYFDAATALADVRARVETLNQEKASLGGEMDSLRSSDRQLAERIATSRRQAHQYLVR